MAPIISIVGRSKSGKTTLVEKLIAELKSRGYRIATVKHTPMGISTGDDDKNTERHLKAGSEATVAVSPDRLVMFKPTSGPVSVEDAARLLGEDYDLILAEGFKQGDAPKIEVHRRSVGTPLKGLKRLFAIVTDEPLDSKVRQFGLDDIKGIADLLEEGYIKPNLSRISLHVNDEEIPLTLFPREIIPSTLIGMIKSLKGVGDDIKTIKIYLKRE
jgi:molybdopterin-guanine dinucleotide biosynthesis protein B